MNTHDIELPAEFRSGNSIAVERATITRERMTEILQDAIEADRQRRGEPVYAYRRKGFDRFVTCSEDRYEEMRELGHAFDVCVFYTAPQPAEPEKVPSDDAIGVLKLALEYWADRQQRYRNRAPVWVQEARALLARRMIAAAPKFGEE